MQAVFIAELLDSISTNEPADQPTSHRHYRRRRRSTNHRHHHLPHPLCTYAAADIWPSPPSCTCLFLPKCSPLVYAVTAQNAARRTPLDRMPDGEWLLGMATDASRLLDSPWQVGCTWPQRFSGVVVAVTRSPACWWGRDFCSPPHHRTTAT